MKNHLLMRKSNLDSNWVKSKYFSFKDSKFQMLIVNQHEIINKPILLDA